MNRPAWRRSPSSTRPVTPRKRRADTCIHCDNETRLSAGETFEATPFQDFECEMCVLGALLMNDVEMTDLALRRLRSHLFYHPHNRDIFTAINSLWQRRHLDGEIVHIGLITVGNQLHRLGLWRVDYTGAYLTSCIESCPSTAAMESYLAILEECTKLRQLHELGEALRHHASTPETPRQEISAGQIINTAHRVLDAIKNNEATDMNQLLENGK